MTIVWKQKTEVIYIVSYYLQDWHAVTRETSSRLLQHSSCRHSTPNTMSCNIAALCLLFISGSLADLSDFVHLEYDAGDIVKPKQPLLAQRDGRFIRFDTGESEIEVSSKFFKLYSFSSKFRQLEMGVSVPFLKIPIPGKRDIEHHGHTPDHRISINPAGLLLGATLLLTSFLLVPWAFPSHGHRKSKLFFCLNKFLWKFSW